MPATHVAASRRIQIDRQMPLALLVAMRAALAHEIVVTRDFHPRVIEAGPTQP
jgi:hypothetical protein